MFEVDAAAFFIVMVVATLAAGLSAAIGPRLVIPVVVLEVLFGIALGPEVTGIIESDEFLEFFSELGLAMLFFFAGYEIEPDRIKGEPTKLAVTGWLLSLAIAMAAAVVLDVIGVGEAALFTGAAMATTAIGTLIPVLSDAGELKSRFGTMMLAAGAAGEFGPILLITLVFSTRTAIGSAAILVFFVLIALAVGLLTMRRAERRWHVYASTIEASGQLAIRMTIVLLLGLVALAAELGLDLLLGGFAAGVLVRAIVRGKEIAVFESKLVALGYGLLIPFFFIHTGLVYDASALFSDPKQLLQVPLFAALFLLVRGAPAMLLYRRVLDRGERMALGVFSATELPLVVAITTIAIERGEMGSGSAAALVGAAIVSTAVYPVVGLMLRKRTHALALENQGS